MLRVVRLHYGEVSRRCTGWSVEERDQHQEKYRQVLLELVHYHPLWHALGVYEWPSKPAIVDLEPEHPEEGIDLTDERLEWLRSAKTCGLIDDYLLEFNDLEEQSVWNETVIA